ncbi:MAG: quaternary ammonium compound-resistance protein SugE [Verrucomicrobia bacterium CG_4_10_14_3_um_filter_43_23]|nr:MAG: QacE family quaternary ammonium compound efflux SMR transporter [Verrucomicrobia bacterium CG1_02_43_26]PIP59553.1 MAG: quaternary ammonium compound-resistance protein SugE [Verrucomicrobia bacterium CG22_combo_CG10-13_8_21_14_all_43_17]PIX58853.1 MAG: quaternary ammonium compound-resistance protein SugE [Verrucomicrobia bacterium CG_4_10_14_3_um_filter_43_23]PIY60948.1 MAG: quaternary ammonium compound-resistance protein SugE [Verrucomicrobia bacterium CG_4_10_14_0_8_um_filter_43_34]PJ
MAWTLLLIAGVLEIGFVVGMKYTEGWTRLWPSIITASCMIISFLLLSIAIKKIPLGTAYAIWTGIGAVGGFIFAIILFGEVASFERVLFLILIVAGITGLKLTSKA